MIFYKTKEEIELMRESALLVSKTHAEVAKLIQPGISTSSLNEIAEEFIRDHGAEPAFKGYRNFPSTLCVSINDQVVHGIPGDRVLESGDIISIDCGVLIKGFYGDSAFTYAVGEVCDEFSRLLKITKEALYKGIEMGIVGNRVGDISYAIQQYAETNGYTVVRELVGHGIGKKLHENPEVPNYGKRGSGTKLKEGMVIAIEPMINAGKKSVEQENDGWTVKTTDGLPSAHFEHTIAIGKDKADILTTFQYIDEVLMENEAVLV